MMEYSNEKKSYKKYFVFFFIFVLIVGSVFFITPSIQERLESEPRTPNIIYSLCLQEDGTYKQVEGNCYEEE